VSETGATQDEVDDATRDEFDDICDENMRLRRALDVAREALERLEKLPCQTCRRDADARATLTRITSILGGTDEPK